MLEVVADALRSPTARFILNDYYQNEQGVWGYYVTVWDAGHYHMISVSHTKSTPTLPEIAEALVCPGAYTESEGRYWNRHGTLGYYATVRSGEHWYMVSVSEIMEPFHGPTWWH